MNFELDHEHQMLKELVGKFVRDQLMPFEQAVIARENIGQGTYLTPEETAKVDAASRELGLWGLDAPEEVGGMNLPMVAMVGVSEELGKTVVPYYLPPDSPNLRMLMVAADERQRAAYLEPYVRGETISAIGISEPGAGADPQGMRTTAVQDGDDWIINGEKWFASHARFSAFLLVMVVTNPDAPIHEGASIFLVEQGTPGMEIIRNSAVGPYIEQGDGVHAYISFKDCRVPAENLLGSEGQGFHVAQTRLGGGRVHHAMRTVGVIRRAIDMMCERALSRRTKGELLADKQMTQEKIADAYTMMMQYRLHVLYTAWLIDKHKEYNREVRKEIAAIKAATPKVLVEIVSRAMHLHGSLGSSDETPLANMWANIPELGVVDGPTEVHKVAVAKAVLRNYSAHDALFPSYHTPTQRNKALEKYGHFLPT